MMNAFDNGNLANPAGVVAAFACVLLAGTSAVRAGDTTFERLVNPEPQNWLTVHHDYSAQRFSPLDAINPTNAKNLKPAFAIRLSATSNNQSLGAQPVAAHCSH